LRQFRFEWPELNAALLASTMRWMMIIVALAGAFWLVRTLLRERARRLRTD
jgi:hypothetical protein